MSMNYITTMSSCHTHCDRVRVQCAGVITQTLRVLYQALGTTRGDCTLHLEYSFWTHSCFLTSGHLNFLVSFIHWWDNAYAFLLAFFGYIYDHNDKLSSATAVCPYNFLAEIATLIQLNIIQEVESQPE